MSGRVVHFEVPFDDGDRARAFYRDVFDWKVQEIPGMSYTVARTGPANDHGGPAESGFVNGGLLRRESPTDRPVIVLDVADLDATLAKVEEQGGSTLLGRQEVGEMGWSAYFTDSEGNVMGLWQSVSSS